MKKVFLMLALLGGIMSEGPFASSATYAEEDAGCAGVTSSIRNTLIEQAKLSIWRSFLSGEMMTEFQKLEPQQRAEILDVALKDCSDTMNRIMPVKREGNYKSFYEFADNREDINVFKEIYKVAQETIKPRETGDRRLDDMMIKLIKLFASNIELSDEGYTVGELFMDIGHQLDGGIEFQNRKGFQGKRDPDYPSYSTEQVRMIRKFKTKLNSYFELIEALYEVKKTQKICE